MTPSLVFSSQVASKSPRAEFSRAKWPRSDPEPSFLDPSGLEARSVKFFEALENRVFSSQGASKPEVSSFLKVLESRKSEVSSFLKVPSFLKPRGLEARSVEFSQRS